MNSVSSLILQARSAPDPEAAESAWEQAFRAEPCNIEAVIGYGDALIQRGRFSEAITVLEEAVSPGKNAPAAVYVLLGEACFAARQPLRAAEQFQFAALLDPNSPAIHNNLCVACATLGRFEEAAAAGERAVELDPDYLEARQNLATAYTHLGRREDAVAQLQKAAEIAPDRFAVQEALGIALQSVRRLLDAREAFAHCVRLEPRNPTAHYNLGLTYRDARDWRGAEPHFRRVAQLKPDYPDIHNLLAVSLTAQRRWEEACAIHRKILETDPRNETALTELAYLNICLDRMDEARHILDRALQLYPRSDSARLLEAVYLDEHGRTEEAIQIARDILRDAPNNPHAHIDLGMWLLALGRYPEAWAEYEWRLLSPTHPRDPSAAPLWDGRPLPDGTLMVSHEQGVGDTILFSRYLPMARERVGKLTIILSEKLVPLFEGLPFLDDIRPFSEDGPPVFAPCVAQVSLPSLPYIFQTTHATIPIPLPLQPPAARVEAWRARFAAEGQGLKVGLVWAGNPKFHTDNTRSPGLAALAPLAQVPGVRFYSLQMGAGREQLAQCPAGLEMTDLTPDIHDYADTAAALQRLDLLITSCTSVAHLAGALGVPTWVALCFAPYWVWMSEREDSPWYPSARLFRQTARGDWRSVYARIARELADFAQRRGEEEKA